jgi:iron complex outermembrane receptor protein
MVQIFTREIFSIRNTTHICMMLMLVCKPLISSAQSSQASDNSLSVMNLVTVRSEPIGSEIIRPIDQRRSAQTYLSHEAIHEISTPMADFGTLANLTPSFVSSAPNGHGFDAAKNMSLRGFADGQFNITLDGIPFADPDTLGHHSTSYFPAATLDSMVVDRSPGSATSLGYSTLGGSLNMFSLELPKSTERIVYGAYGAFNTSLAGFRYATAKPTESGQSGLLLNFDHQKSDGSMNLSSGHKSNVMVKTDTHFNGNEFTTLYAYDDYHFFNPISVTAAQIAANGSGAGFNNLPSTPGYFGYASTDRSSDFGYARLRIPFSSHWVLTETLYTYSYANKGLSLNGDITKSNIGNGFGVPSLDIGGRRSDNRFRTFGNIVQAERRYKDDILRAGLWLDSSNQSYNRIALDLTTGLPYNANTNAKSPVLFDFQSSLTIVQPFAEYEWKATDEFSIRPGLRLQQVQRSFDASVVPNSLPGTNGKISRTVNTSLPSLDARYAFNPLTQAYVQWSKGALVPSQSFFYTKTPNQSNQANPQNSTTLQTGFTRGNAQASATADVYVSNIDNYISAVTQNGSTQYVNNGKVKYSGLELECQSQLGYGFTGLINASMLRAQFQSSGVTSAKQQSGDDIPLAPHYIGLVGLMYKSGLWSSSLINKFVGSQYQGKNGSSDGPDFFVPAYNYTNFTVTRYLEPTWGMKDARLSLQINNLTNQTPVTDAAGLASTGSPLVNVLTKRNAMVSLSFGF